MIVLNDQGGGRMDITEDITQTLRAEAHGHPPPNSCCVWIQTGSGCGRSWNGMGKRGRSESHRRNKSGSADRV